MKPIGIVLTIYNSSFNELKCTLKSIISQVDIDFDLVIADDGSKNDVCDDTEKFLKDNCFYNYSFVKHHQNKGTVENFYDGVKACNAEYIRGLGQGDMLFDKKTLHDLYYFAKETDCDLCISKYVNFNVAKEIRILSKPLFPQSPKSYKNPDELRKYYLLFGDVASGISTCYKKNTLLHYLEEIKGKLIYAEDLMINLMVYDKCKIHYYPRNTIWYENDNGISQNNNDKWKERILNDWKEMVILLMERCSIDKKTKFASQLKNRIIAYNRFINHPNRYNHVRYLISVPGLLIFTIKKKIRCLYSDTHISQQSIREYFEK